MSDSFTVDDCKNDMAARIRNARAIAIVENSDGTVTVEQWSKDSVCPSVTYPNKREAAARVLQLLGIGPVAPQTWPETVCIGSVDLPEEFFHDH